MTESVVGGSTDGTCACAKAALDASVGIDFVFAVTLGNCADGAVCCTCAACDASFSDTISHGYYLRKIFDSEAAQLPQQYFTTKTAEIKPFRINKLKAALYDIQCGRKAWFISKNYLLSIASLMRSEEHTSELQSRQYLVCRLLLEKIHPFRGMLAQAND